MPHKKNTQLSDSSALKILRAGLKPEKQATEFDWERIGRIFGNDISKPPNDSITIADAQKKFGVSERTAGRILKGFELKGLMQSELFSEKTGRRRYYWWKKP